MWWKKSREGKCHAWKSSLIHYYCLLLLSFIVYDVTSTLLNGRQYFLCVIVLNGIERTFWSGFWRKNCFYDFFKSFNPIKQNLQIYPQLNAHWQHLSVQPSVDNCQRFFPLSLNEAKNPKKFSKSLYLPHKTSLNFVCFLF
jgi:hypothetical protein